MRIWKRSAPISEVGDPHFKSLILARLAGRARRRRTAARHRRALRARRSRRCATASTSSSSRTARAGAERIPIPSLLACAAVHHHLIRKGLRTSVGLVVESGEPREVHHFGCLAGYGAEAINPYLAFETLLAMQDDAAQSSTRRKSSSATSSRSTRASSR